MGKIKRNKIAIQQLIFIHFQNKKLFINKKKLRKYLYRNIQSLEKISDKRQELGSKKLI